MPTDAKLLFKHWAFGIPAVNIMQPCQNKIYERETVHFILRHLASVFAVEQGQPVEQLERMIRHGLKCTQHPRADAICDVGIDTLDLCLGN
jgi:hypothetical protein